MKCKKLLFIFWLMVLVISCDQEEEKCKTTVARTADTSTTDRGFNFFVLGDWGRRGGGCQQAVANQMMAYARRRHPAFIITTGDNFYEHGVTSVSDAHWTQSFTNVYKELTTRYDWYPVLGNHDYEDNADPKAQIDYSRINAHWKMPYYYSTMVAQTADHQPVRFVFIDTNPFYKYYYVNGINRLVTFQDTAKQRKWIETTLSNAKEPWKFVIGHHPVYSGGFEHGNTPELVSLLQPLLQQYKVQAYICGHDHNLQHQHPAGSYVDYFVCGGGSAAKPVIKTDATPFALSISGFADITIRGDSLTLQYIDNNGNIVYSYARRR